MSEGRYKIIRVRKEFKTSGAEVHLKKNRPTFFTDRMAVDLGLSKKAKELALQFAGLGDGFRQEFLKQNDRINERETIGVYQHYERILRVIDKTAKSIGPELREKYLLRAGELFKAMKNELPAAPFAYETLGNCLGVSIEKADFFVEETIKARDNEALPRLCKKYGTK